MIETPPVRTVALNNGLILRFRDNSNRYFGDFHRAHVVVEGIIDSESATLTDEQRGMLATLPDAILYRRELERMGVTSDCLADSVSELIESFLESARDYLERPDIPEKLLSQRLSDKVRRR